MHRSTRHAATLPHAPHRRRAWAVLLLVCATTSAVFAFAPAPPLAAAGAGDKLWHGLAFAAMATCWAMARDSGWARQGQAFGGLLLYGVLIEAVQSHLPSRSAEAADVLADAVGIACGLLLAAWLRRVLRRC